ncbi:MAG TPA: 2-hydroxyacid dehydrogenase [Terracidiphilus sp.]|jgi:phosphoglycerate dehydrogenase-like enzyme|nr:2-hydroxyacid dehydrogenase [Terracidiphilus sp.]
MLRVGYPATLSAELLRGFPEGIETIPISDKIDRDVEIDVWIPDPYSNRAMRAWPRLRGVRLVLSMLAGTEWIPPLVGPHVTICNARGAHNVATAEWTVAAILAMLKYLPLYLDIQQSAAWKRRFEVSDHYAKIGGNAQPVYPPVLLEELAGKTVLLVGYGEIGKEIERMLTLFRVNLLRMARTARAAPKVYSVGDLNAVLPQAEIVVLILPSTAESHWLIDRAQFALMPQGALLVNAARGPIVNTDALVEALNAGRVRAALDVTDPEPLPQEHPLWSCPNLLLTPHVGASSPQFSPNALRTAADELRRYMNGEPLRNVVQAAI